ncbi:hypothetical protein EYY98_17340 [Obesumbacterium proteus]|nr:hypothetical protein EYY98_17340 [Obesumbacterium proteus]
MDDFIVFGGCHNGYIQKGILEACGNKAFLYAEPLVRGRDINSTDKVRVIRQKEFSVETFVSENGKTYLIAKLGDVDNLATIQRIETIIKVFSPKPIG